MSNTSSSTTTSPVDLNCVSIILSIIEKYLIVILYIFGLIGSLLNIFIFLQKRFRMKSCSIYFLSNSLVDFIYINSYLLMQLISLFNSKIFLSINSTNLWCKLGNYFYFLLPCLASTYITFASIDRFCASSSNNKLQKFNQLYISYILALSIFLIWALFSLHIPISYGRYKLTSTSSIQCNPRINIAAIIIIIDGYFFALFNGIINPFFLIIFGLLIFRNVKYLHRRISPTNIGLTRENHYLIKTLLFQVSLTVILYIPYIVLYLYEIYNSIPKYWLTLLFYLIFSYIGRWFWFINYCKAFYINIFFSKTFRKTFKQKILRLQISNYHGNTQHQSIPITNPRQSPSDSDISSETPHPTL